MKRDLWDTWKETCEIHEKRPVRYMKRDLWDTWKETYEIHEKRRMRYMKRDLWDTRKETYEIHEKRPVRLHLQVNETERSRKTYVHEKRHMKQTRIFEKRPIIETYDRHHDSKCIRYDQPATMLLVFVESAGQRDREVSGFPKNSIHEKRPMK